MALVTVEYVGPFDAVDVPAVGAVGENAVKRGGSVQVSAEVAAGLLEQPDNWREAKPAKAAAGEKGEG